MIVGLSCATAEDITADPDVSQVSEEARARRRRDAAPDVSVVVDASVEGGKVDARSETQADVAADISDAASTKDVRDTSAQDVREAASTDARDVGVRPDARLADSSPGDADAAVSAGGSGLHVVGRNLVDGAGRTVVLRGFNANHMWDEFPMFETLKFAGNSVRVVFGLNGGVAGTTAQRKAVVEQYIAGGKYAIPGIWSDSPKITCGNDPSVILGPVVAQWISDKAYLQAHEDKVIVNVANEWADFSVVWRDTYITAIQALRTAGIRNVIMVDAGGGCGQFGESINKWGPAIQAADPLHNVMFSVHLYAYWYKPGSPEIGTWQDDGTKNPWSTDQGLVDVVASGLPVYVGEFAASGYEPASHYDLSLALATMDRLGIGGAAWMVTNSHTERWDGAEMSTDGTINHLTPFGVKVQAWAGQ